MQARLQERAFGGVCAVTVGRAGVSAWRKAAAGLVGCCRQWQFTRRVATVLFRFRRLCCWGAVRVDRLPQTVRESKHRRRRTCLRCAGQTEQRLAAVLFERLVLHAESL